MKSDGSDRQNAAGAGRHGSERFAKTCTGNTAPSSWPMPWRSGLRPGTITRSGVTAPAHVVLKLIDIGRVNPRGC